MKQYLEQVIEEVKMKKRPTSDKTDSRIGRLFSRISNRDILWAIFSFCRRIILKESIILNIAIASTMVMMDKETAIAYETNLSHIDVIKRLG
jgi:hypothetical protein